MSGRVIVITQGEYYSVLQMRVLRLVEVKGPQGCAAECGSSTFWWPSCRFQVVKVMPTSYQNSKKLNSGLNEPPPAHHWMWTEHKESVTSKLLRKADSWGAFRHGVTVFKTPRLSSCSASKLTHLVGDCCSVSELWDRAGGLELRFTQAFSFGGGAGITFSGCSDLGGLEVGEWQSSSLLGASFSRDFSLSLLRASVKSE